MSKLGRRDAASSRLSTSMPRGSGDGKGGPGLKMSALENWNLWQRYSPHPTQYIREAFAFISKYKCKSRSF